jgi:TatD DNase family protein
MRGVFEKQLEIAAELRRPVALHGAKCWGEIVRACRPYAGTVPAFVFHGFSRSDGLLPEIFAMNGYVSVGPAVLNDHAVNYREMVKTLPLDRLLVETDRTAENAAVTPSAYAVAAKVAELRGIGSGELEGIVDANAAQLAI